MADKYVYRGKTDSLLASTNTVDTPISVETPFYEGLVTDVIVDHFHPLYAKKDGYNVGSIKVRIFSVDNSRDDELLDWADPMDSTIQEYPLLGELVIIQKILGNYFYSRKSNIARRLQENGMLNLNKQLNNRPDRGSSKITSNVEEVSVENHKFGEYFKPDSRVRPLKHFEGDVIIQGRMGHSIRFGSSQLEPGSTGMAPNLILRTGQAKNVENDACTTSKVFGLIVEDINKDASSIWLTSDQKVPFEPITIDAGSFFRSVKNPPQKYDGASVIINSDRVVLDAKKTHIMMFANEEIHLNSFKQTSIDTDNSIVLTANIDIRLMAGRNIDNITDVDYTINAGRDITLLSMKKTTLLSEKVFIGSLNNDKEPMVGGASLSKWLARFILILMGNPRTVLPWTTLDTTSIPPTATSGTATTMHVITPMGPGMLHPDIVAGLISLYKELSSNNSGQSNSATFAGAPFNSIDNFVMLSNDTVNMEFNDFKEGNQKNIENNKWILSDPYYKVV